MSLLEEAMTKCIMLEKTTESDGMGGSVDTYTDGQEFYAAIVVKTGNMSDNALSKREHCVYTVTTRKNTDLNFYDIFKRLSDNKTFRVIPQSVEEYKTPNSAWLNMKNVDAEEWEIPV